MSSRVYVGVLIEVRPEGVTVPRSITWEDGRKFDIDKVTDVRPAASIKAGGTGMRYTCMIKGKEVHLWDEGQRWFMERKGGSQVRAVNG